MTTLRTILLTGWVVSLFTASVSAQWVQTNGPYGGDIRSFAASPNGVGGAQVMPSPGERVRIRYRDGTVLIGIVASFSVGEVRLHVGSIGSVLVIPHAEIAQIEWSLGRQRSFGKNFAIAWGATSVGVGVWSALTWEPCTETEFLGCGLFYPTSRREAFGVGALAGVVIGVPVGLIVGLVVKNELWAALPPPGSHGTTE